MTMGGAGVAMSAPSINEEPERRQDVLESDVLEHPTRSRRERRPATTGSTSP
jgi:hypothetical protein